MLQEHVVFIVDDDASVREALSSLLRSTGLQVETFDSAQAFQRHPRPDAAACLVLDVRMPGLSGLDLQHILAESGQPLPIVFITGHGDIPMTVLAMKAGAVEFLPKPFRDHDLLAAVAHALERDVAARLQRADIGELQRRRDALTPRENEVMKLVVKGLLNKQVAAELGVSEITVKVHRRQVMGKMKASSVAELVRTVQRLEDSE